MSDIRKNEEERQTRTERELEKLGEGSSSQTQTPAQPVKPKPKPKKPAEEKRGTGRNDAQANFNRLSADLRKRIDTAKAAGNNTLAAKLEARLIELKKITEQSQ